MILLKQALNKFASRFGYNIMKYPSSQFDTVPVFDLSVQFLMAVQGQKLEFIQIGANDGSFGDPLRKYILKFPWHGIVVEPQPDVFARLCANYDAVKERLLFENIAIADHAGTITMYRRRALPLAGSGDSQASTYAASVSSMNPEVVARQLHIQKGELERFSIPCSTLDKLAVQHQMFHIDVLQIDAEGQDFSILKTLDLSSTAPLIVQLEHGHLSPVDVDKCVHYLSTNGYRILYGGRQSDTLALHETFPLA